MSGYTYEEFPKWKYHADREPLIVPDADAEKALGPDWYDRQADAHAAKQKIVSELKKMEKKL